MEEGFRNSARTSIQSAARAAKARDAQTNRGNPEQRLCGEASPSCSRRIKLIRPSTSPPPEPPQERYMLPGDDHYRIVEDELLQTAQRFTTHLHRAEYNRLKLIAKSKNGAAIREIERPVVGPLTSDAKRRRDQAKRLSKQRSVLSAQDGSTNQDESANGNSPWAGTNLRGLLNAPRAEIRSLPPQTSAASGPPSSLTKAAVGHCPAPLPASTPRQNVSHAGSFTTPVSTRRARHPVTPASSTNIASSSSTPRRNAKIEAEAPTLEDDLDFDDPFGINKRRLDRQKSRDQLKKTIRSAPTNTPSSSDTMPSFV
ncbi:hypothetical protein LEL_01115 [Akanthomyces lecanii RCEF 1005]|uniref:Uncharacterized protein n=1 Tax=Akanthomyces lecanii RCEF 1005 TaxID=1081108 RepID=A0A168KDX8_CORDF|nr:hypothetical protein LEL_01115 [Akanthomyces lecanii RCEF 1005]